jgi:spore coat-associated protein N
MRWYRVFLSGVVLLGALTGLVDSGTFASFASTGTGTANVFAAGSIDIANSPASALLSISDMVPGETVTAPLTVTNGGTLQLRYALASTVTNPDAKGIGAQLTLTIKSGVTTCTNAGFGSSGTVLYGSAPLGALGSSLNLIGTPASFPNGGRTLAASSGEALCFQVSLPAATGTSYQGGATTATFAFSAQQI